MLEIIEAKLHADVQGTCTGQYGFIIAVLEIIDVGPGIVLPGNGQAEFRTRYKAIVFKPFKGEVLDGVVTNVLRVSNAGNTFWNLTEYLLQAGFFVEVGPLRCFVSQQVRLPFSSSGYLLKSFSAGSCRHAVRRKCSCPVVLLSRSG
jgi:DNA-directed RNA polymerase II subunit RPB7